MQLNILFKSMIATQNDTFIQAGKRVIDISKLLDVFEAEEGEIQQIIGKTGQGKTYEATRRALKYLRQGKVVYTTWRLNLPDYFDERESVWYIIKNILLFKKHFFRFDYKQNWHHVDIDRPDLIEYVSGLTDCILMMDEGQDVYDARERADKTARHSLTRTRHMHKTIIIISQRAQAVDVTARANVTYFYKCVKKSFPFLPSYFRVYRTEEMDNQNYPVWAVLNSQGKAIWRAKVWHAGFAKKYVYDAYDSWYLRKSMTKSQEMSLHAFELKTIDKFTLLFARLFKRFKKKHKTVNLSTFPVPIKPKIKVQ